MNATKNGPLKQYKWHIVIVASVVTIVVLLTVFTDIFRTTQPDSVPQFIALPGIVLILAIVVFMLAKTAKIFGIIKENGATLDQIAETLEKNRTVMTQLDQSARLSETAKAIVFRDTERQSLREAVFDKLQQQDFNTTYKIIDEISQHQAYKELAEQLRIQADKYRDATDQERENQVIAHIEKLFESFQWPKASVLIERLIKASPNSEKAKAMRQRLLDKKQERKKALLTVWDDAVKRQATDQSLEILRELDLYLSPNEGLALQEAARDVFRTKLHNLGVQFSLAVSEKQWDRAFQIGGQIMRDFPNSKMAEEIREKWDILQQNVRRKKS